MHNEFPLSTKATQSILFFVFLLLQGAQYLGCFNVNLTDADVRINISTILTPELCIQTCQMLGHKYALVVGTGKGCLCQHAINESKLTSASEEKCFSACSYDPIFSCGSDPYGHLYDTGKTLKSSPSTNYISTKNNMTKQQIEQLTEIATSVYQLLTAAI